MTDPRRRSRHAIATIVAALALAVAGTVPATAPAAAVSDPPGIDAFMKALGQVESGGNYYARNSTTGAYGKYQIMPSSWAAWAEKYLGNASAPQTPANQEYVARCKIRDLYWWLGSWPVVAHWWLTGSSSKDVSSWSSYSRSFVDKVMTLYKQYSGTTSTLAASWSTWQESNANLAFAGGWSRTYHDGYMGDYAKQNSNAGAYVRFRFTGNGFQWIAPKGPGRGKARVYVNDVHIATVDLYASYFKPRNVVFQRNYLSTSTRSVRIVVAGTSGRPKVAVDAILIRR